MRKVTKAWVYWNLHKNCWSVKLGRLPVAHVDCLMLSDVQFKVRQAGNERVNNEKRKNVHAFAVGVPELMGTVLGPVNLEGGYGVTYNPYKYKTFVRVDNTEIPVYAADRIVMYSERVSDKVIPRVLAFSGDGYGSVPNTPTEQDNANQPERGGYEVQRGCAV